MRATFTDFKPRLAALVYQPGTDIDLIFHQAVAEFRRRNIKVGGIIQCSGRCSTTRRRAMFVEDLSTGRFLQISQDLGAGARSCILDPAALATAAQIVRHAVNDRVDVIVVNRFGEQEACGRGLRSELAEAAIAGAFVLTALKACHLEAWRDFGGEFAAVLKPKAQAVCDWIADAAASKLASRRAPVDWEEPTDRWGWSRRSEAAIQS